MQAAQPLEQTLIALTKIKKKKNTVWTNSVQFLGILLSRFGEEDFRMFH